MQNPATAMYKTVTVAIEFPISKADITPNAIIDKTPIILDVRIIIFSFTFTIYASHGFDYFFIGETFAFVFERLLNNVGVIG